MAIVDLYVCLAMVVYNDEKRFGDVKSAMMNHLMEKKKIILLAAGWLMRTLSIFWKRFSSIVDLWSTTFRTRNALNLRRTHSQRPIEFHGSHLPPCVCQSFDTPHTKHIVLLYLNLYQSHITSPS